jgi:hypothetical protein
MAWKVKNESVNPANRPTDAARASSSIPRNSRSGASRLGSSRADAITEAPDAEFEQWKRDEADRQTKAQRTRSGASNSRTAARRKTGWPTSSDRWPSCALA